MPPSSVTAFLASHPGAMAAGADRDRLGAALELAFSAARAAHPALPVSSDDFAAYLGARVEPDRDAVECVAELAAGDLLLALGCERRLPGAVEELDRVIDPVLRQVHARVCRDALPFDELAQKVREQLFVGDRPAIASYRGRGPLLAWVRVVATRSALRWAAKIRDADEIAVTRDELLDVVDRGQEPELAVLRDRYRGDFAAALEAALSALEPRDRSILRYRYLRGLPIDAIAEIYGLHRVSVSRLLRRTTDQVFARTRAELAARLELDDDEVGSIIRLVRSDLELHVSQLLAAGEG